MGDNSYRRRWYNIVSAICPSSFMMELISKCSAGQVGEIFFPLCCDFKLSFGCQFCYPLPTIVNKSSRIWTSAVQKIIFPSCKIFCDFKYFPIWGKDKTKSFHIFQPLPPLHWKKKKKRAHKSEWSRTHVLAADMRPEARSPTLQ